MLVPEYVLPRGKYKGKTAEQVVDEDPQYILWMERNMREYRISVELREMLGEGPGFYPDLAELELGL